MGAGPPSASLLWGGPGSAGAAQGELTAGGFGGGAVGYGLERRCEQLIRLRTLTGGGEALGGDQGGVCGGFPQRPVAVAQDLPEYLRGGRIRD